MDTNPKSRYPNNNKRALKEKSYQEQTLTLHIPLELDDEDLDRIKMEHISWLCLFGDEGLQITTPYFTMGEPLIRHILSIHDHHMNASLKHKTSSRWIILNLHFIYFFFTMLMS
jgi:hypothetical protein